jgi:hypothetical protein
VSPGGSDERPWGEIGILYVFYKVSDFCGDFLSFTTNQKAKNELGVRVPASLKIRMFLISILKSLE